MKRFLIITLVTVMMLSLCACGSSKKSEESSVGIANPIHECEKDELVKDTGIPLDAPAGAEEVRY